MLFRSDADPEAGVEPTAELVAAMMDYHEQMGRHLKILGGDGLHPSAKGARVKFSNGKPLVIDGPFAETKEHLLGFYVVEAESREAAIEGVITRHGTLVGPLMTELTGYPELTPYGGGWCGNDVCGDDR